MIVQQHTLIPPGVHRKATFSLLTGGERMAAEARGRLTGQQLAQKQPQFHYRVNNEY